MNRDELLKKEIMSKKDTIKNAFLNRLTYDKWDKKSPVYACKDTQYFNWK